jgi:hypothetical protein
MIGAPPIVSVGDAEYIFREMPEIQRIKCVRPKTGEFKWVTSVAEAKEFFEGSE